MRNLRRWVAVIVVMLAGWAAPPPLAQAANLDTTADRVWGQTDFTHGAANSSGVNASGLHSPFRTAFDRQGNLYVADFDNKRVLEYDAPLAGDHAADRVFGQPDFTHVTSNTNGLSANSLASAAGLALDEQGNLYVADSGNHRVLEYDAPLTSDRTADRVFGQPDFTHNANNAGNGILPTAASFSYPEALALDAHGNLFVVDLGNNRVLQFDAPLTSDHTADRVFGQPGFGSNDINFGGLSATSLYGPEGLALDAAGNLYVADTDNHRVLEYDLATINSTTAARVFGQPGFTSAVANNGGISADSLYVPYDVALDAAGNLYVADFGNSRALEYDTPLSADTTADHVFGQTVFGTGSANNGGANASAASLNLPTGVLLDAAGNLYVADYHNNRVLEYDLPLARGAPALAALSPATLAAGSPSATLTVNGAGFYSGSLVRWNGSSRPTTFLNSTQLNATLTASDLSGGGPFAVTVFTPGPGGGTSSLVNLSLYPRAGQDAAADAVQGQPAFSASTANNPLMPGAHRLRAPVGAAVDKHSGRLFVADHDNNRVLSWPSAAALVNGQPADRVLGQPNLLATGANNGGLSARSLNGPAGLALDALGNLYVADTGNYRVLEYDAPQASGMAASRVFGQGGSFTTAVPDNGGVSANSLLLPYGLALDASGSLYVADFGDSRVLEYDTPLSAGATADRVFGQANFAAHDANGTGLSANTLANPTGVALDAAGDLYVGDTNNNRVLEYNAPLNSSQAAARVFGQADFTHNDANHGGLGAASLDAPEALALDGWGRLYISDHGNNRVLEYARPLSADHSADRLFGQPDAATGTPNTGGVSSVSLAQPEGVAVDGLGNLYVADFGNNRLLEYDWALVKIQLPLVRR